MFAIKLVPDQDICIIAYKGEAEVAHDFARMASRYYNSRLPMPIEGCGVGLIISKIDVIKIPVMEPLTPVDYRPTEEIKKISCKVEYGVMLSGKLA